MNSQPAQTQGKRLRLPLALFAAAVLAIQIGWLIGTPAYGQMDEIDHAYRAASVAQGHWTDHGSPTPEGRGYPIRVPLAMVTTAHSACARLKYMKPGNCSPLSPTDRNGDV
ncbi:MAG TPA: hypothetical protein VN108_11420, partial [Marmoricola sp.]|nr:hypothetical protein [Marmoricola sp.]